MTPDQKTKLLSALGAALSALVSALTLAYVKDVALQQAVLAVSGSVIGWLLFRKPGTHTPEQLERIVNIATRAAADEAKARTLKWAAEQSDLFVSRAKVARDDQDDA